MFSLVSSKIATHTSVTSIIMSKFYNTSFQSLLALACQHIHVQTQNVEPGSMLWDALQGWSVAR